MVHWFPDPPLGATEGGGCGPLCGFRSLQGGHGLPHAAHRGSRTDTQVTEVCGCQGYLWSYFMVPEDRQILNPQFVFRVNALNLELIIFTT